MTIFDRVLNILEAEVNVAMDALEDPELMLAQALRDGEDEVRQSRQHVQDLLATKLGIEENKHREWANHLQWEARAVKALALGDEALAREALSFSLEHRRASTQMEEQLLAVEADLAALNESCQRRERKLNMMRERHDAVLARLRGAQVEDLAASFGVRGESPLDLYARMEAKLKREYHRGEAAQQMAEQSLAQKLDGLSGEHGPSQAVKDKLAAIKAKLANL